MIRALTTRRGEMAPFLLLFPAIATMLFVVALPLVFSLWTSLTPYKLTKPDTLYDFIWFRNYVRIFEDWDFWAAFLRTIAFLTVALNVEFALGLGIALLINKITWGQRGLRTIMMFPMMFSPILVGFQFKFLFNDHIGVVNNALQSLGLTDQAIPWLIDGNLALFSTIVAEVWSSTSVFAILILAGLMAMPKEPPALASLTPPVSGLLQPTLVRLALEKLLPAKGPAEKISGLAGLMGSIVAIPISTKVLAMK